MEETKSVTWNRLNAFFGGAQAILLRLSRSARRFLSVLRTPLPVWVLFKMCFLYLEFSAHKNMSSSVFLPAFSSVCHPRAFHSKLKIHLFKNSYPDSPYPLSPHSPPELHPP